MSQFNDESSIQLTSEKSGNKNVTGYSAQHRATVNNIITTLLELMGVELRCCIPETNVMLYENYTKRKRKNLCHA